MKTKSMLFAALGGFALGCAAAGNVAVQDDSLGLSRVSVFEVETPSAFDYPDLDPKTSGTLPRAWEGAPPQIPHSVKKYLPVKAKLNECLDCHEKPETIGKGEKGKSSPMPDSHYVQDGKARQLSNRHYVCTLCHAPQVEVQPLMGNTFMGDDVPLATPRR